MRLQTTLLRIVLLGLAATAGCIPQPDSPPTVKPASAPTAATAVAYPPIPTAKSASATAYPPPATASLALTPAARWTPTVPASPTPQKLTFGRELWSMHLENFALKLLALSGQRLLIVTVVGGGEPQNQTTRVRLVDLRTGRVFWEKALPGYFWDDAVAVTPAALFVLTFGHLYKLNLDTGAQAFDVPLPQIRSYSPPVFDAETQTVSAFVDQVVLVFDANTGEPRGHLRTFSRTFCDFREIAHSPGALFINTGKSVQRWDLAARRLTWETRFKALQTGRIVFCGQYVWTGLGGEEAAGGNLHAFDPATGQVLASFFWVNADSRGNTVV